MAENKALTGLNGWLLFFFIVYIIGAAGLIFSIFQIALSPLLLDTLTDVFGNEFAFPQLSASFRFISIILLSLLFFLYLFMVIGIGKRRSWAIRLTIIGAWTGFAVHLIQRAMAFSLLPELVAFYNALPGGESQSQLVYISYYGGLVLSLLLGAGWCIAVTLYFLKSKRVKNTLVK